MAQILRGDEKVVFRVPARLKREIERAAKAQNRSVAEFAASALEQTARQVLTEKDQREHVQLTDDDRDRFLAMLDSKSRPNTALREAAKRFRKRVA